MWTPSQHQLFHKKTRFWSLSLCIRWIDAHGYSIWYSKNWKCPPYTRNIYWAWESIEARMFNSFSMIWECSEMAAGRSAQLSVKKSDSICVSSISKSLLRRGAPSVWIIENWLADETESGSRSADSISSNFTGTFDDASKDWSGVGADVGCAELHKTQIVRCLSRVRINGAYPIKKTTIHSKTWQESQDCWSMVHPFKRYDPRTLAASSDEVRGAGVEGGGSWCNRESAICDFTSIEERSVVSPPTSTKIFCFSSQYAHLVMELSRDRTIGTWYEKTNRKGAEYRAHVTSTLQHCLSCD